MSEELKTRIVAALTGLVEDEGATLRALQASQDLVTLESVIADASGDGLEIATLDETATSLRRFLVDAADSLEAEPGSQQPPNQSKAARALLGLEPNSEGARYRAVRGRRGRQAATAEWLDKDRELLDKPRGGGASPRDELIERIASQLLLRENEHLIQQRQRAQRARRAPLDSAMTVEWLGRFQRYFRMYTPMSGVYKSVELAVGSDPPDELCYEASLHHHANFLLELDMFVREAGGLWILPDIRTENLIADANWYVRRESSLSEFEESLLRLAVRQAPELAQFVDLIETDQALGEVASKWRQWINSCACAGLPERDGDCKVHAVTCWIHFYMTALEAQWDFLADWYARPRSGSKIDMEIAVGGTKPVLPPREILDILNKKT